jgi:hypothetical protein
MGKKQRKRAHQPEPNTALKVQGSHGVLAQRLARKQENRAREHQNDDQGPKMRRHGRNSCRVVRPQRAAAAWTPA